MRFVLFGVGCVVCCDDVVFLVERCLLCVVRNVVFRVQCCGMCCLLCVGCCFVWVGWLLLLC